MPMTKPREFLKSVEENTGCRFCGAITHRLVRTVIGGFTLMCRLTLIIQNPSLMLTYIQSVVD